MVTADLRGDLFTEHIFFDFMGCFKFTKYWVGALSPKGKTSLVQRHPHFSHFRVYLIHCLAFKLYSNILL